MTEVLHEAYITAIRLNRSLGMLIDGMPLEDVARLNGFRDANYYIKVFKKRNGMTPAQFRTLNSERELLPDGVG